jgi:outer membrane protein
MREYTEAKDLEAKYKAQSSERETTRSRDQSFQARCIKLSGTSTSNGQEWAQNVELNCKKRTRIRLCTASFSTTTTATRWWLKWIL